jgi:steroid delta-isomerase-like uncharacterized protein
VKSPAEAATAIFARLAERDLSFIDELCAPDYTDDYVPIGVVKGRDAVRAYFEQLFAAFPDFDIAVDRVVGDDRTAVVQWHASGTFSGGPFQGIESTGRRVELRGVEVMEFDGDGIVLHDTIYYDGATFGRQVGLLPARGSMADKAMQAAFNVRTKAMRLLRR